MIPLVLALAAVAALLLPPELAAAPRLEPCRLRGVEHDALCGQLRRPLDPSKPDGTSIELHFAVLPALARNKHPDPLFFLAGGPGQSAIDLAGPVGRLFQRISNRRDVVLVDQRGTGRSAPLACDAPAPTRPLRELVSPQQQRVMLADCLARLKTLPQGDLRQYTTTIAMADLDAVREHLGAERINLVGGSYGTRAALEYLRQFPQRVRRMVIDGVAPPDMVLPASFSTDAQASFDALIESCRLEPACRDRHPALRERWQGLLASLPREVSVAHPLTGQGESLQLTREMLVGMVRLPLYLPRLASALPEALEQAADGRFGALLGLLSAMSGPRSATDMAMGMHFSVVCAEDMPRLGTTQDRPGADFGASLADIYRAVCADWPRGQVPDGFYEVRPASTPVLVLSGGIDPVTPPRHGERVATALGANARHVVVPNAGHGVMGIGCMRDVLFRFVDAQDPAEALKVETGCVEGIPRPPAFRPVTGGGQ